MMVGRASVILFLIGMLIGCLADGSNVHAQTLKRFDGTSILSGAKGSKRAARGLCLR